MDKKEEKLLNEMLSNFFEGLNNPLTISWTKNPKEWLGTFSIDNTNYEIKIKNFSEIEKHFLFKFTANNSFDLTNDVKKAFSVIPTIDEAATNFIKEEKPQAFMFCAIDESTTRKLFYDRFCHRIRKNFKYNYKKETVGNKEFYILTNGANVSDLKQSLEKISNEYLS